MSPNYDEYIAEKEKIKLNFNRNKETFLKQKENNDNLKIKVEELNITIEEKTNEIDLSKQEVKCKEMQIDELKKQIRKFKNIEEEIIHSIDNLKEFKLSCEKCGEMFKTAGLLRRHKKMFHEYISS